MSSRTTLLVATTAAAFTLAIPAQAQETPPAAEDRGIGSEVRDIARDQDRTDDQRGIGAEVREIASAEKDDTVDNDDDGDTDEGTDASASAGIGAEARAAAQDPAREGGVGAEVSATAQAQGDEKPGDAAEGGKTE